MLNNGYLPGAPGSLGRAMTTIFGQRSNSQSASASGAYQVGGQGYQNMLGRLGDSRQQPVFPVFSQANCYSNFFALQQPIEDTARAAEKWKRQEAARGFAIQARMFNDNEIIQRLLGFQCLKAKSISRKSRVPLTVFAEYIGYSRQTVYLIMNRKMPITDSMRKKLSDTLKKIEQGELRFFRIGRKWYQELYGVISSVSERLVLSKQKPDQ